MDNKLAMIREKIARAEIEWATDKCHASMTNKEVFKFVINFLKDGWQSYIVIDKAVRRRFMQIAIERHTANRRFYHSVMG